MAVYTRDMIKHVYYSLKHLTPVVTNQKYEPHCFDLSMTDMVETSCKIYYGKEIVLSPQAMIDRNNHDVMDGISLVKTPSGRGLERLGVTPYRRVKEIGSSYQTEERFSVDDVHIYDTPLSIKVALSTNFSSEGQRFPAVAVMRMGNEFVKRKVAAQFAEKGKFFREPRPGYNKLTDDEANKMYGVPHAMLITGINTESREDDDHYVEVKNSYGKKWGHDGFANTDFALLDFVIVPKLGGPKTSYCSPHKLDGESNSNA